jgi:predicted cation transporter
LQPTLVDIGLFIIFLLVLVAPFVSKRAERNLEAFLFLSGIAAVTLTGRWHSRLIEEAISEPITKGIVPAVLVAGLAFYYGRKLADRGMAWLYERIPVQAVVFVIVVALGLGSSVITAIIAALLLVEFVNTLPIDRETRVEVTITACFSIGLGAALTPLGEPLSTIAITKLQNEPFHAGFFFLFDLLAIYIVPGIIAMGVIGAVLTWNATQAARAGETEAGSIKSVLERTVRVYAFVAALILLGEGFKVLIDKYFAQVPSMVLFWLNMVSAILDNATLTAAEIAPSLQIDQIRGALMGLLISGGMLIPGNIPNIIAAHKLSITSKEWARLGVPIGLVMMLVYFVWLFLLPVR